MTEIVMLVWLGDVARSVSFMLALLLLGCVFAAVIVLTTEGICGYDYKFPRALARWGAVGAVISALALAHHPVKGHHLPVRRCASGADSGNHGTRGRSVRCAAALAA